MTFKQILDATPALNKLASAELDIKTAYRISKTISALQGDIEFFNSKKRQIIEKYGKVNDDGSVDYSPGKQTEAEKDLEELINLEVQAEIVPVELPTDGIKITANDILALEPFVSFVIE